MVGPNAVKVCSSVQSFNVSESSLVQLSRFPCVPRVSDLKFAQTAIIQRTFVFALISQVECLRAH
jgi:hypothetical protein